MPRPKTKESKPLTIRLDAELYDRLTNFTQDSGQSKTVAVERALDMYIKAYENQKVILEEAAKHSNKIE